MVCWRVEVWCRRVEVMSLHITSTLHITHSSTLLHPGVGEGGMGDGGCVWKM